MFLNRVRAKGQDRDKETASKVLSCRKWLHEGNETEMATKGEKSMELQGNISDVGLKLKNRSC